MKEVYKRFLTRVKKNNLYSFGIVGKKQIEGSLMKHM